MFKRLNQNYMKIRITLAGQGRKRQDRAGQGRKRQDRAGQGRKRLDRAGQGRTGQDKVVLQYRRVQYSTG